MVLLYGRRKKEIMKRFHLVNDIIFLDNDISKAAVKDVLKWLEERTCAPGKPVRGISPPDPIEPHNEISKAAKDPLTASHLSPIVRRKR